MYWKSYVNSFLYYLLIKGSTNVFHKLMKYLREQVLIVPSIKYSIKNIQLNKILVERKIHLKDD